MLKCIYAIYVLRGKTTDINKPQGLSKDLATNLSGGSHALSKAAAPVKEELINEVPLVEKEVEVSKVKSKAPTQAKHKNSSNGQRDLQLDPETLELIQSNINSILKRSLNNLHSLGTDYLDELAEARLTIEEDSKILEKEAYNKFALAASREIYSVNADDFGLNDPTVQAALPYFINNYVYWIMDLFGYDVDHNLISVKDPHSGEVHDVNLSNVKAQNNLDTGYLKYYFFAIKRILDLIKSINLTKVKDPAVLTQLNKFEKFSSSINSALSSLSFSRKESVFDEVKKSLDSVFEIKKTKVKNKIHDLFRGQTVNLENFGPSFMKDINEINEECNSLYLSGSPDNKSMDSYGALQLISDPRINAKNILGDEQKFFDSFIEQSMDLNHFVVEEIEKNTNQDVASFLKNLTTTLSESSLHSLKVFMSNVKNLQGPVATEFASQLSTKVNKRKMALLAYAGKFGLTTHLGVRDVHMKSLKEAFYDKTKSGSSVVYNFERLSANEFKTQLDILAYDFANRHGALFKGQNPYASKNLEYSQLIGFGKKWLGHLLQILIYLNSNLSKENTKIRDLQQKIQELEGFFHKISKIEAGVFDNIDTLNQELKKEYGLNDKEFRELGTQIDILRRTSQNRSIEAICGFNPLEKIGHDAKEFKTMALEIELDALISVIAKSKKKDSDYKAQWQKDLYKSRLGFYTKLSPDKRKQVMQQIMQRLIDLTGGRFNIMDFVNKRSIQFFLNSLIKDLLAKEGQSRQSLAYNLSVVLTLSKLKYNASKIFDDSSASEDSAKRLQAMLDDLINYLHSSQKISEHDFHKGLYNLLSDGSTATYLLKFLNRVLKGEVKIRGADEFVSSVYYLALKSLQAAPKDQFLGDNNDFQRKILEIFFDSNIRARIKKMSPRLYKLILKEHRTATINFYKNLETFVEKQAKDLDLDKQNKTLQTNLKKTLVDVYYPLQQEIAAFSKEDKSMRNYGVHSFKNEKLMSLVIKADPQLAVELRKIVSDKDTKRFLANKLLEQAYNSATIVNHRYNDAKEKNSFDDYVLGLLDRLENASDINFIKSDISLADETIRSIFFQEYNSYGQTDKRRMYVRLAYSVVKQAKSLKALTSLLSVEDSGHLFIGDDLFMDKDRMKTMEALNSFYGSAAVLDGIFPLTVYNGTDKNKKRSKVDETEKEIFGGAAKAKIASIKKLINAKPVFYITSKDLIDSDIELNVPNLKDLRDEIITSFAKVKNLNVNTDGMPAEWIKLARKEYGKDENGDPEKGLLDSIHDILDDKVLRQAIKQLTSRKYSSRRIPYSKIYYESMRKAAA